MFGAIQQHLKQYLIHNFSTHSRREGTITMIVLQCTKIHHFHSMSCNDIFPLSSSIAFLIKRDEIHVKNKEKPTFLLLKVDSILQTALSESPIWTPLKPKNENDTLIGARYIYTLNDLIGACNIPFSVR